MKNPLYKLVICFLMLCFDVQPAFAVSEIKISVGEINSPSMNARNSVLSVDLKQNINAVKLQTQLKFNKQPWAEFMLNCDMPDASLSLAQCGDGLYKSERILVPFKTKIEYYPQQTLLNLEIKSANFSDELGLHAGEKIAGKISATLIPESPKWLDWRWQVDLIWNSGEIFWQPFYLASQGHQLKAQGKVSADNISIERAHILLKDIANIHASAQVANPSLALRQLQLQVRDVDLALAYPVIKPLFEKTSLNNIEIAGKAELDLSMLEGEPKAFNLKLLEADLSDKTGRFAFYKVNANLPWSYDEQTQVELSYAGGNLLKIPLGNTRVAAQLNRYALTAHEIKLPMLDSAILLKDVSTAWVNQKWHWHLSANIADMSMADFSTAVSWPRMEGVIAAQIPMVTYTNGELSTQGDIRFKVFDGNVTIGDLKMQNPLGISPKLTANMKFRTLDLGKLTRTFSFGAIEGKLDGDVNNLEFLNWNPVSFDAVFRSSAGDYPRKISQRAVENISALGGAGAAAAVQRSLLRFFEQFNYASIGLSCRLRNNQCEMNGVESTTQGYVIVKGSGIPAITVLGYNRSVSWSELLGRVKRITEGNAPVIK